MEDNYGPNFITITDEETGEDIELEYIDALEHNGVTYSAFFPVLDENSSEKEKEDEYGLIILKTIVVDGEELLSTLDSDEELNEIYDLFMEQLIEDEDNE